MRWSSLPGRWSLNRKTPLRNSISGAFFEQLGNLKAAIEHLVYSVDLMPALADAHLNLALAYEKTGQKHNVIRHLSLYVRYEPNGPWADFARSRIAAHRTPGQPSGKLTPFRRTR